MNSPKNILVHQRINTQASIHLHIKQNHETFFLPDLKKKKKIFLNKFKTEVAKYE